MKQASEITSDELAEVIFKGDIVPALSAWLERSGYELQAWPSGNESATDDPKYHSFIVTPKQIPAAAIEGLTPEQVEGYAKAWNESGTGMDL